MLFEGVVDLLILNWISHSTRVYGADARAMWNAEELRGKRTGCSAVRAAEQEEEREFCSSPVAAPSLQNSERKKKIGLGGEGQEKLLQSCHSSFCTLTFGERKRGYAT